MAAMLVVAVAPSIAHSEDKVSGSNDSQLVSAASATDRGQFYDARYTAANQRVVAQRTAALAARPGVRALKQELGVEANVDMDAFTGTPRQVSKTDGFLTGPSGGNAAEIAVAYVRAHAEAFGLAKADIDGLVLRKSYTDIAGSTHLSFVQMVGGLTVFGNGLKAHVARDGSLISLDGSPLKGLPASLPAGSLTASAARGAAIKDVGGTAGAESVAKSSGADTNTVFANDDTAVQVAFQTLSGTRLAWQTISATSAGDSYIHVIDAKTGQTLYRRSLIDHEADPAQATGNAWDYFPGSLNGGTETARTLPGLPANAPNLSGLYAHVYLDLNNNNRASANEEVGPNADGTYRYPFTNFIKQDGLPCSSHYQCSWDPKTPGSWDTNAKQNAVQVYYFMGTFHDHLEAGPIGFTREAGNFDARDGDAVITEALDGANGPGHMPGDNSNNANMNTLPDGQKPRMQMYLFYDNGGTRKWLSSNSGDSADIIYHEYTHGLSNRLIVDAVGNSTMNSQQAGSMGEAFSDWYAMDFLVNEGFQHDSKGLSDMRVGDYVGHGVDGIRSQPIDCVVGSADAACHGTPLAGTGGYTYGDFGKISSRGAEVHADGEIWSETLWDLRCEIGSAAAESLLTRGMELSPSDPTYLDERNAILLADTVVFGGKYHAAIWKTFAHRGMGFFAAAFDGTDTHPAEDFSVPPKPGGPTATLSGHISDAATGTPAPGILVYFGGHPAALAGGSLSTFTDANGDYSVPGLVPGTYAKISIGGGGFEPTLQTVVLPAGGATANFALVRDWAAGSGGGSITEFTGPDYTPSCGPGGLIDMSQGVGWGSNADREPDNSMHPQHLVIALPRAVDISEVKIDPSNTCGDGPDSATGGYTVETSADGVAWVTAASGTFLAPDVARLNVVPLVAGKTGVKFIRYTMLTSQVFTNGGMCPGPSGGCIFVDSTELIVHGSPSS